MWIEHTEVFKCPAEHLWTFLEEPQKQKLWMKGLQENVPTSAGPQGVGSTFLMKIKEGRKVAEYQGEVTAYDRPRHLAVSLAGGPLPKGAKMLVDYRLSPVNGQTKLDYACQLQAERLGFFLRLLLPLAKLFSKMMLRRFMKKLKQHAEAPAQAA
jgi:uncharacterized protein YndB with AHSA1/START domain